MRERRRDPTTGEWTTFVAARPDASTACGVCAAIDALGIDVAPGAYELVVLDDSVPALDADAPEPATAASPLYAVGAARGASELLVYGADHGTTLADLDPGQLVRLIEVWADRYAELGSRGDVGYVLLFEEANGDAQRHPHGRLHAYGEIPPRPRLELEVARRHLERRGTCVLCDVVARERADGLRLVADNASFVAFVPFAARFPYEVHVATHRHAASLLDLTDPEREALASVVHRVLRAYGSVLGPRPAYLLSIHQAPTDDGQWQSVSHFHLELAPPPRAETQAAYLAGSERAGGTFVNETTPEAAAAELRAAVEAAV